MALAAGTTIGPYVIERMLGEGGMGAVYLARGPLRPVALKLLPPEAGAAQAERFRREGEAQARVAPHPHVLPVLSAGEDAGRSFLVLELAEGGDLAGRLRGGPLPIDEAVGIVHAVASGVAHLHRAGVLHRDLKPANVLFDRDGRARVTDFGLARVSDGASLTRTGELLGTPGYMPPEQVDDAKHVDERSDVYALGALLYATLTGRPPFDGGGLTATIYQVLNRPPPGPRDARPDVPGALDALVRRALAKAPGDRPATAADFARELAGATQQRPRRRVGRPLAIAGLALAAALPAAGAALRAPSPAAPPPAAPPLAAPAPALPAELPATAVAAPPARWSLRGGEALRYRFAWTEASAFASACSAAGSLVVSLEGDDERALRGAVTWELERLDYQAKDGGGLGVTPTPPEVLAESRAPAFAFTLDATTGVVSDVGPGPLAERLAAHPALAASAQAGEEGNELLEQRRALLGLFRPEFGASILRALFAPAGERWRWTSPLAPGRLVAATDPRCPRALGVLCSTTLSGIVELRGRLTVRDGRPQAVDLHQTEGGPGGQENTAHLELERQSD